jgi:formate/nitrite transporter
MNSPAEIANICLGYGINKVRRPLIKTFVLAIIGGFLLGASSLLSNVCSYNYTWGLAHFYFGLVFPIGIMAIYCAGAELFTGNCLLTIPLLNGNITLIEILLNWLISFVGNFIGAILLSVLVVYGHVPNLFNKTLAQIMILTGTEKTKLGFGEAFVKGLLCNFYNCLAIWVSFGGKELRSVILGLWPPIFLFASVNLEHCVANMHYIPAGLFASYEYGLDRPSLSWGRLFYKNLIPVTLGNIIGGGALVGIVYWYIYLGKCGQDSPSSNPSEFGPRTSVINLNTSGHYADNSQSELKGGINMPPIQAINA